MDDSSHQESARNEIGAVFALLAAVLAALYVVQLFSLVGSVEYAQDITQGTHTADYGNLHASAWFAGGAAISALIAAITATKKARTIGAFIFIPSALYLLALLPG